MLTLGQSLCRLSEGAWAHVERSPFHPQQILWRRGEVLQEVRCRPVRAAATEGNSTEGKCYLNTIPVRVGSERLLLEAGSRVVVEPAEVTEVPCSTALSPIFVTDDMKAIVADPSVRQLPLDLTGHGSQAPLLHALDSMVSMDDDRVFQDILYSADEIRSFTEYLHYSRVKDAVTTQLVGDFCHGSKEACGSYKPRPGYNLDLTQIQDKVFSPLAWVNAMMEHVREVGAYSGFGFLIWFLFMFLKTFITTIRMRLAGYFWTDSFQIARGYPRGQAPDPPVHSHCRLRSNRRTASFDDEEESLPLPPIRSSNVYVTPVAVASNPTPGVPEVGTHHPPSYPLLFTPPPTKGAK